MAPKDTANDIKWARYLVERFVDGLERARLCCLMALPIILNGLFRIITVGLWVPASAPSYDLDCCSYFSLPFTAIVTLISIITVRMRIITASPSLAVYGRRWELSPFPHCMPGIRFSDFDET